MLLPIFGLLQSRLPLKLREKVYENIFDVAKPIVVPKTENADDLALHPLGVETRQHPTVDLDPFDEDYYFNPYIMGSDISTEVMELVLGKPPSTSLDLETLFM
jgi:hypothetical protein